MKVKTYERKFDYRPAESTSENRLQLTSAYNKVFVFDNYMIPFNCPYKDNGKTGISLDLFNETRSFQDEYREINEIDLDDTKYGSGFRKFLKSRIDHSRPCPIYREALRKFFDQEE